MKWQDKRMKIKKKWFKLNSKEEKYKKKKTVNFKTSLSNKNKKNTRLIDLLRFQVQRYKFTAFSKNFSNKSDNILNNSEPILKTAHKSYYPNSKKNNCNR